MPQMDYDAVLKRVGRARSTLERWRSEGQFPAHVASVGRKLFWDSQQIEEWCATHLHKKLPREPNKIGWAELHRKLDLILAHLGLDSH